MVRDCMGHFLGARSVPDQLQVDPKTIEVMAALYEVQFSKDVGFFLGAGTTRGWGDFRIFCSCPAPLRVDNFQPVVRILLGEFVWGGFVQGGGEAGRGCGFEVQLAAVGRRRGWERRSEAKQ